jgi:hypothetical protein
MHLADIVQQPGQAGRVLVVVGKMELFGHADGQQADADAVFEGGGVLAAGQSQQQPHRVAEVHGIEQRQGRFAAATDAVGNAGQGQVGIEQALRDFDDLLGIRRGGHDQRALDQLAQRALFQRLAVVRRQPCAADEQPPALRVDDIVADEHRRPLGQREQAVEEMRIHISTEASNWHGGPLVQTFSPS